MVVILSGANGPPASSGSPANLFAGVELAGWGRKNPRICLTNSTY